MPGRLALSTSSSSKVSSPSGLSVNCARKPRSSGALGFPLQKLVRLVPPDHRGLDRLVDAQRLASTSSGSNISRSESGSGQSCAYACSHRCQIVACGLRACTDESDNDALIVQIGRGVVVRVSREFVQVVKMADGAAVSTVARFRTGRCAATYSARIQMKARACCRPPASRRLPRDRARSARAARVLPSPSGSIATMRHFASGDWAAHGSVNSVAATPPRESGM